MSLKIHILYLHLDFFTDSLEVSNKPGERFYQDISDIETQYHGKPNDRIMSNYCCYLQGESNISHRHKAKAKNNFQMNIQ